VSGAYLPAVGERLPDWRIGPFDAAALAAYAEASGDANPLHLDDALARAIGFPAPPVHGMKLLAAFEPLLSAWRRDLFLARLSGKFVQPVLRGEAVTISLAGAGFTVSQPGEALEAGGVGAWIRVKPAAGANQPLRARIVRPGLVEVDLGDD
jgi:acyl dehydratase